MEIDRDGFYNGAKLLTLTDLNKKKPELYLCCGNRTAGKTFYYKRMLLRKFVKKGSKFMVLVRFSYELDKCADNFFNDIGPIDFKGSVMTSKPVGKNLFQCLYLDGKHCGYVVALNAADTIKKYSANFVDVDGMFMDEFQSEVGKYCPDEVHKFQSIHVSVARGGGQHVRYVPVYMCSNSVTIINPFFVALGIHKRIRMETRYLRGNGWVMEQTFNASAAEQIRESGFYCAFQEDNHMKYVTGDRYLLDNYNFVDKLKGEKIACATLIKGGKSYGVWQCTQSNYIYVSKKYDPSCGYKYALDANDHDYTTKLIRKNNIVMWMRKLFDRGMVVFEDVVCKDTYLDIIGTTA